MYKFSHSGVKLFFVLVLGSSLNAHTFSNTNFTPPQQDKVKNNSNFIHGVKYSEYIKMLNYLKEYTPNKQDIIKVVLDGNGNEVNCVNIYSQKSLKNRKLLLKPRYLSIDKKRDSFQSINYKAIDISDKQARVECPMMSIPMRKLSIEDLLKFKTLDNFRSKYGKNKPKSSSATSYMHEYAIIRNTGKNYGSSTTINVWSPYTEKSNEFSLSQLWVSRGNGSNLETVEAGIQKYKDLYGDWRSHLFIYFTPDNYGNGGCYNLSCNKFVQVSNNVYIGGGFNNYSQEGGKQYEITLKFLKDGDDGDWWLQYGDTWVGYYPKDLFDENGIKKYANSYDFGGEIVNSGTTQHTRTDMGSGYFSYKGWQYAAYQRKLIKIDSVSGSYHYISDVINPSLYETNSNCYDIDFTTSNGGDWGSYFYFGGSGYNANCQ